MEAPGEVGRAGNLRVFVGLALPVNIGEALGRALHAWTRQYPEIAWEEPEALHLTLQFIGSYPLTGAGPSAASRPNEASSLGTPIAPRVPLMLARHGGPRPHAEAAPPRPRELMRLEELEGALQGVKVSPFRLHCAGTGAFPHGRRPRVVWAGVERTPALMRLAAAIPAALSPLGIIAEPRPFTPHISLARIKVPGGLPGWRMDEGAPEWGEGEVREFQLFQTLSGGPRASRYAVLRRFEMSHSR